MKKDTNARLREAVRQIVTEMAPEAGRVDSSIMSQQLRAAIGDAMMEAAMSVVLDAEEIILAEVANTVNQHNMTDTAFGRLDARSLRSRIEEFEESAGDDDYHTLQQEAANDIEVALTKFADQVGEYAVHIIGPSAR